jgi:hypothetical protein
MSIVTAKDFLPAFTKTLGVLFLYILIGLFIDSQFIFVYIENSQLIANGLMGVVFTIILLNVPPRIREQMIYAALIGVFGEYLFSIFLGMYTYRLENVPHYIPMGHALIYIGVLYFCKTVFAKINRAILENIISFFVLVYATAFLVFAHDIFGFVMSMAVLIILINKPKERLFYLTMYVVVAFLEIVGTYYQCWKWPETAWDKIPFLKSANPPSGISLVYFLLDLGCLWLYKKRHKIAWNRMKNIRKLHLKDG